MLEYYDNHIFDLILNICDNSPTSWKLFDDQSPSEYEKMSLSLYYLIFLSRDYSLFLINIQLCLIICLTLPMLIQTIKAFHFNYLIKYMKEEDNNSKAILVKLPVQKCNYIITYDQIKELYQDFTISNRAIYYPYNHQHQDVGWGCAWRAIQMLLSTQQINFNFALLYSSFSEKDTLLSILKEKTNLPLQTIEYLKIANWSPAEIECHWAEPFIASIICHSLSLPHFLYLLNGPVKSYAPKEVFQKIINFQEFSSLIKKYIVKSSMMIDDGHYALSIIGVIELPQSNRIQFLFADPHIRSNRNSNTVGIYRKTFDINGNGVTQDQTQIQRQESLYGVYQQLEFCTKQWMLCMIMD